MGCVTVLLREHESETVIKFWAVHRENLVICPLSLIWWIDHYRGDVGKSALQAAVAARTACDPTLSDGAVMCGLVLVLGLIGLAGAALTARCTALTSGIGGRGDRFSATGSLFATNE